MGAPELRWLVSSRKRERTQRTVCSCASLLCFVFPSQMDLAIGVAIGSSTQIALFLIPFVTLLGWVISQPMSLNFSGFETICLVMAVLLVSTLLKTGESNWLQGVMLIALYVIIATGE